MIDSPKTDYVMVVSGIEVVIDATRKACGILVRSAGTTYLLAMSGKALLELAEDIRSSAVSAPEMTEWDSKSGR